MSERTAKETQADVVDELFERLLAEQGVRPHRNFEDLMEGTGEPGPEDGDLYEVIMAERKARRDLAQEKNSRC
jgi:hypothetical protein